MRRLALLATAFLLAGCPRPLRFGPEGELRDPQALLRLYEARSAKLRSVKAEAKISLKTPQQSGTAGQFVAAQKPAALHLETLNFFGKPVAVLVADGDRFALFSEQDGTFTTGPASAANVSRLLPINLDPREAVMLLLGEIPMIPAEQTRLEVDAKARAYLLTLTREPIVQRVWIGTEDYRPLRSEVRGVPAYDLAMSDFETYSDIAFPTRIDLRTVDAQGNGAGVEVTLRYKDIELNPDLEPALFTLEQPAGSRRIEVDEAGRALPSPALAP